jgi:hypothetical protein
VSTVWIKYIFLIKILKEIKIKLKVVFHITLCTECPVFVCTHTVLFQTLTIRLWKNVKVFWYVSWFSSTLGSDKTYSAVNLKRWVNLSANENNINIQFGLRIETSDAWIIYDWLACAIPREIILLSLGILNGKLWIPLRYKMAMM